MCVCRGGSHFLKNLIMNMYDYYWLYNYHIITGMESGLASSILYQRQKSGSSKFFYMVFEGVPQQNLNTHIFPIPPLPILIINNERIRH